MARKKKAEAITQPEIEEAKEDCGCCEECETCN